MPGKGQMLPGQERKGEGTMNKVVEERTKRTGWYRDARFGMFIHWGLYAIPACGEWLRSVEEDRKSVV